MSHKEDCKYKDDDCLQYCLMNVYEDKMVLMSASELVFFEELLESAKRNDANIVLDYEQPIKEPYKLVYGLMKINVGTSVEEAVDMANRLKDYAMLDIGCDEKNKMTITVSGYTDIYLDMQSTEKATSSIPFCALMKTTHDFENLQSSISMFPSISVNDNKPIVWECMMNRPFLLGCRSSSEFHGTIDKWKEQIDFSKMKNTAQIVDYVFGDD